MSRVRTRRLEGGWRQHDEGGGYTAQHYGFISFRHSESARTPSSRLIFHRTRYPRASELPGLVELRRELVFEYASLSLSCQRKHKLQNMSAK